VRARVPRQSAALAGENENAWGCGPAKRTNLRRYL